MSEKPTAGGRIVSAQANKSATPTTIVLARSPNKKQSMGTAIAGRVGMLALLILASIGVVFTVKHRSARPQDNARALPEPSPVQVAQTVVMNRPAAAKPKPPMRKANAMAVPAVRAAPVVEKTKPLALQPPRVEDDLVVDDVDAEPTVARTEKPSLEPTFGSKDAQAPAATVDNGRPNNDGAAKLAPTDVPGGTAQLRNFGTQIEFVADERTAFDEAKKDKNTLVLVITYAGSFKDGSFASKTAEQFRTDCLMKDGVANFLKDNNFVCVLKCVSGLAPSKEGVKAAGSVVSYFCQYDRTVLHAVAGAVDDAKFLEEARWAVDSRKKALEYRDPQLYANQFRKAHTERFFARIDKEAGPPKFARDPFRGAKNGFDGGPGKPPGPPPFAIGRGLPEPPSDNRRALPNRPVNADPQTQIHWLLATKPLPNFDHFSDKVYVYVLKEQVSPK